MSVSLRVFLCMCVGHMQSRLWLSTPALTPTKAPVLFDSKQLNLLLCRVRLLSPSVFTALKKIVWFSFVFLLTLCIFHQNIAEVIKLEVHIWKVVSLGQSYKKQVYIKKCAFFFVFNLIRARVLHELFLSAQKHT